MNRLRITEDHYNYAHEKKLAGHHRDRSAGAWSILEIVTLVAVGLTFFGIYEWLRTGELTPGLIGLLGVPATTALLAFSATRDEARVPGLSIVKEFLLDLLIANLFAWGILFLVAFVGIELPQTFDEVRRWLPELRMPKPIEAALQNLAMCRPRLDLLFYFSGAIEGLGFFVALWLFSRRQSSVH
jgi:hypothetical protein